MSILKKTEVGLRFKLTIWWDNETWETYVQSIKVGDCDLDPEELFKDNTNYEDMIINAYATAEMAPWIDLSEKKLSQIYHVSQSMSSATGQMHKLGDDSISISLFDLQIIEIGKILKIRIKSMNHTSNWDGTFANYSFQNIFTYADDASY